MSLAGSLPALLSLLLIPAQGSAPAAEEGEGDTARAATIADHGEIFVNANSAYENGDFAAAVGLYETLVDRGIHNGYLYYNLGNAYLRSGELGRAIASFRRCQRLLPREEDVQANLDFARKSTRDAIEPPRPSSLASALFFWHYASSRGERMRLAVVLNVLLWSLLAWRLYRRESELLRWSFLAVLVILVAVAGSLVFESALPQRLAVVVPQEIDVHSGNDTETVVRFKLHAGTEVEVVEARRDWLRIRLPDGEGGWIESRHAEVIGPPVDST